MKHLQYIEYTPDNLKLLTARIKECFQNNKYVSDFYEILNIKGIIPFVSDNQEEFVEYLRCALDNNIAIITQILNSENIEAGAKTIGNLFNQYENLIRNTVVYNRFDVLEGILKYILSCFATVTILTLQKYLSQSSLMEISIYLMRSHTR